MDHRRPDCFERLDAAEQAVRDRPLDAAAHAEHGHALARTGHRIPALDAYRQAVMLAPEDPKAHRALAVHYVNLDEWTLATQHYLKAVHYGADDTAIEYDLGWASIHEAEYFLHTDAYKLIEEVGRQLASRHIRDGKLEL